MTADAALHNLFPCKPRRKIEELIREKHAEPIKSVDDLMIPGVFDSDDEVDEFNAEVRAWRDANVA